MSDIEHEPTKRTGPFDIIGTKVPKPVRTDMAKALDKKLDVDAAAADIQRWSDKMRKNPIRRWEDVPPEGQELYRLLVYRMARSLVGDRDDDAVAGDLVTKVKAVSREEQAA